jgi:hypothetical protein
MLSHQQAPVAENLFCPASPNGGVTDLDKIKGPCQAPYRSHLMSKGSVKEQTLLGVL